MIETMRVLAIGVLLVACKSSDDRSKTERPAPPVAIDARPDDGKHSAFFTKMSGYTDQMCACKDTPCVDKLVSDMNAFSNAQMMSQTPLMSTLDEKDAEHALMRRLQDCEMKIINPTP